MKSSRIFNVGLIAAVILCVGVVAFYVGIEQGKQSSQNEVADQQGVQALAKSVPAEQPVLQQQQTAAQARLNKETHQAQPKSLMDSAAVNFTHFRVGQRNIKSILPDGEIMWVGTSGGVIRYDTRTDQHKLYDLRSGLLAKGVFYLGKIKNRLAVGTYGGGLALMKADMQGWDIYNIPEGLADAFVYDMIEADNGDIWIATWSGANRIRSGELDDPSKWDTFTVQNTQGGLPNDWVYALEKDDKGNIWLATEGGLARYKDGAWQNWKHEDGLGAPYELVKSQITFKQDPAQYSKHHARQKVEMGLENVEVAYNPNYIVSLIVDRQGIIWAGTWGGGLTRFDGSKWQYFTVADGLPGNHVFMLHEDPQGKLWVGTNNGLAQFKDGKFSVYTTHDGLFSNNVFSMATAHDDSKWIGSYGGVARITDLSWRNN